MRIARKRFQFTGKKKVIKDTDIGIFRSDIVKMEVSEPQSFAEAFGELQAFVASLAPGRFITINERTEDLTYRDDDGKLIWIVWYWEDDAPAAQS